MAATGAGCVDTFSALRSLSLSFIFSFALLPHRAIIAIKMKYLAMQSESVRPSVYIALGHHHGKAHIREKMWQIWSDQRTRVISFQLRHFASAQHHKHRPFFPLAFAIGFDRFYQLNWIRSAGPFFRVNIKADAAG